MKIKDAKLCGGCDEVYTGKRCPVCGFDQGISLAIIFSSINSEEAVKSVKKAHPEKVRFMIAGDEDRIIRKFLRHSKSLKW